MHGQSLARFIVGILGNIIAGLLFLSPTPTILRIWKKKSTEEFQPYPYLASTLNCMFSALYGLPFVHPGRILIITINAFGLFMEIVYLVIFMVYATNKKYRKMIIVVLLVEVAMLGAVAAITLLCFETYHYRSMFVGTICVVNTVAMYAAPLSIIAKVVKTKSAEFMPFWLSLTGFLSSIVWFCYAFLVSIDPYIAIGNGFGIVLGLVQLLVYGYYTLQGKQSSRVVPDAETGQEEELDKKSPL